MADSDTQAEDLLELELDGRANLGDLVVEVLRVGDGGGELASCGTVSFCFCIEIKSTYPWRDRDQGDEGSA